VDRAQIVRVPQAVVGQEEPAEERDSAFAAAICPVVAPAARVGAPQRRQWRNASAAGVCAMRQDECGAACDGK
jgi:hypothetical protein